MSDELRKAAERLIKWADATHDGIASMGVDTFTHRESLARAVESIARHTITTVNKDAELDRLRAENERLRVVDVNKALDDFLGSMEWREETSKEIKNLVIDNLRGFAILVGMRLNRSLETQPRESPDDPVDR